MRIVFSLLLILSAPALSAQAGLWAQVDPDYSAPRLAPATLSALQRNSLFKLFKSSGQVSVWECAEQGNADELFQGLTYEVIPLSARQDVILVEAGAGCARGGQGANGAMWLVRFDRSGPVFLATPKQRFNGWLFSIQPEARHGYRDIILGWHMSAFQSNLSYFRFDGTRYRCIGTAADFFDENRARIVPDPRRDPEKNP